MPQRQLPTPHPPIGGLVQGFLYPTHQPPARALARQQPPATPALPIHGSGVATTTESYLFPVTPPRATRRSYRVGSKVAVHTGTIRDVTADTVLTYQILQPDRQRLETQPTRYRQDVWAPQYSVFIPTVNTDFWTSPPPTVTGPVSRAQRLPTVPIEGLPEAGLPGDVFVLNVTPDGVLASYRQRPKPVLTLRGIRGPAVVVPNPTALVLQPGPRWWTQLVPDRVTQLPILAGVTTQATFLYPTLQPEGRRWRLTRLAQYTEPIKRLDGVEPQALFLFPVAQPQGWTREQVGSRFVVTPQVEGAFTPPAVAETYLFEPGQPSRTQWFVPRTPSEQIPAPLALAGPPSYATEPIPEVGGSAHAYWPWRYQVFETATRSLSPVIWSVIVAPIVPPLAAADACDTFAIGADPGAFGLGADQGALMVPADRGSFTIGADPGSFVITGCDE